MNGKSVVIRTLYIKKINSLLSQFCPCQCCSEFSYSVYQSQATGVVSVPPFNRMCSIHFWVPNSVALNKVGMFNLRGFMTIILNMYTFCCSVDCLNIPSIYYYCTANRYRSSANLKTRTVYSKEATLERNPVKGQFFCRLTTLLLPEPSDLSPDIPEGQYTAHWTFSSLDIPQDAVFGATCC